MTPQYPLYLPDRDRKNDWYLNEDVEIVLHNGHKITVKKGFKWDSHSVPWFLRWFLPRYIPTDINEPNDIWAAFVHDALIAAEHWLPYPRKFQDYEYHRFHNMPEYFMQNRRRKLMPRGVRLWGWLWWDVPGDYRGEIPEYAEYVISGAERVV